MQIGPERCLRHRPALTTAKGNFAMADRADITPDLCRQLLRYDPATGKLFWRDRPVSMFADLGFRPAHAAALWNSKWAGKEAFTAMSQGYHVGAIFRHLFKAHRVAWAIVHGSWPSDHIDHISGNRADNRIGNLRDVPNVENHRNESRSKNNTSGVNGVCWDRQTGRWRAGIKVNYRHVCLGRYDDIADAIAARRKANRRYGFTERHGT